MYSGVFVHFMTFASPWIIMGLSVKITDFSVSLKLSGVLMKVTKVFVFVAALFAA